MNSATNTETIQLNRGRKLVFAFVTPKADATFDLMIVQQTGKVSILLNQFGLTRAQVDAAIA